MTRVRTGTKKLWVNFESGGCGTIRIDLYEGKTLEECLKMYSEYIIGYWDENDHYIDIQ